MTYHNGLGHPSDRLVIYIEGDGRAFVSRRRVSANPTPHEPTALQMALADPSPAVAYVARPCQFIDPMPASCEPRYWTTHRYAPEVVAAVSAAIDELKRHSNAGNVTLIGYSGGGVIAALIAQRRSDIDWLVTVASNLDHAEWTSRHDDTPLTGSLNPADHVDKLAGVAQLHLAGRDDDVVPPALIASFVRRLPAGTLVEFLVLDDVDHNDWPAIWQQRLCNFKPWKDVPDC